MASNSGTIHRENAIYDSATLDKFSVKLEAATAKRLKCGKAAVCEISPQHVKFTGKATVVFPLRYLRRYGISEPDQFYIEAGRRCDTGEGMVNFKTSKPGEDKRVLDLLDRYTAILAADSSTLAATGSPLLSSRSAPGAPSIRAGRPQADVDRCVDVTISGNKAASGVVVNRGSRPTATFGAEMSRDSGIGSTRRSDTAADGSGGDPRGTSSSAARSLRAPPGQAHGTEGNAADLDAPPRYASLDDMQRVTDIEPHGQDKSYSTLEPAGTAPVFDYVNLRDTGGLPTSDATRRESIESQLSPGQVYAEMNFRQLSMSRSSSSSAHYDTAILAGSEGVLKSFSSENEDSFVGRSGGRASVSSAGSHGYGYVTPSKTQAGAVKPNQSRAPDFE